MFSGLKTDRKYYKTFFIYYFKFGLGLVNDKEIIYS